MDDIIKVLHERIGDILTILFFSCVSFIIYMLAPNTETVRTRMRGAFLGFFISLAFSYPVYLIFGNDKWWALAMTSSVLTISGQFLPELIQSAFKKYVTTKVNNMTEDDKK
jgi:hypothetical protein